MLSRLFSQLTQGFFALPLRWPWTTYGKALRARDLLLDYIEEAIQERMKAPSQDALSLLIETRDEEGQALSLRELKCQTLLMLFAGHDTTTSMLSSLMLALTQHPKVLERARQEQADLGFQGPLSLEQIKQMRYLEQVLKEVERAYPPVQGGFRGVVKPFSYNGYRVPAGWMAMYSIRGTHDDPEVYPSPLDFDPERFDLENKDNKRSPFALVGFGGGPRVCLGYAFAQLEMKIIAAMLLREYAWELLPNQDLRLKPIPTLHPKDGLQVRFFRQAP